MPFRHRQEPVETATHTGGQEPLLSFGSLLDRLDNLRRRLMWAALAVVVGTIVCWGFSGYLYDFLALPLTSALAERGEDPRLAFTRLTDPFIVYLSVAMLGGVLISSPLLVAQLWQLITPATGVRRLAGALAFVTIGTTLFLAGTAFGHQIMLPFIAGYLLDMASGLQQMVTARDYLRFAVRLLLVMGASAQLPLVSFALARFGLVTARRLWRWFPYATLAAFTLAALITPPDGVSQVLVALPMMALYLCSIAVAALAAPRRR